MTTYKFSNFPKATVAFGNSFRSADSEKLKEHLAVLKKAAVGTSQALEYGQKYALKLKTSALIAGKFASVMTVLVMLVGEVDKLYEELKQLEQKIFNTIFEGKLQALNRNLRNLEDASTSEVQKVAEIVNAISHLDELLPVFAKEDSIFRERYYHGAPLFVQLCAILKAICLIAEQTTDYNTSNLQSLKQGYQKVLDWYRIKCIGRRMASCYTEEMLIQLGDWTHDWHRHYEIYKKYYENSTWFAWTKYSENLGGKGWRLWYGWAKYCNLIDTWDTRPHDDVKFEAFEIKNTSANLGGKARGEREYLRDVLAEYRRRVEEVMLEFFNDASVIT